LKRKDNILEKNQFSIKCPNLKKNEGKISLKSDGLNLKRKEQYLFILFTFGNFSLLSVIFH